MIYNHLIIITNERARPCTSICYISSSCERSCHLGYYESTRGNNGNKTGCFSYINITEILLRKMEHFKILLETGKKRSEERILFVQTPDIIGAMDISRKIRDASMKSITPISEEAYYKGVDKKYDERLTE